MAITSSTQAHTIVGTFHNGRKIVSTVVTALSDDIDITPITINPLTRILTYIPSIHTTLPADATYSGQIVYATGGTSGANIIWMTPDQIINGSIIEIISIGI